MRKPKPRGNHKHAADECGICAKPESFKERQKVKEQVKEQLNRIHLMKKIYYKYCSYSQIFWNEKGEMITGIHENDGEFRAEYMDSLFEAVGAKLVNAKKIPQSVRDDECFENYADPDED